MRGFSHVYFFDLSSFLSFFLTLTLPPFLSFFLPSLLLFSPHSPTTSSWASPNLSLSITPFHIIFLILVLLRFYLCIITSGVEALLNLPGCSVSADSVSVLSLILQVRSLSSLLLFLLSDYYLLPPSLPLLFHSWHPYHNYHHWCLYVRAILCIIEVQDVLPIFHKCIHAHYCHRYCCYYFLK